NGGKASAVTISGAGAHRIFNVVAGGQLTVDGLTLTDGHPSAGPGGAIANSSGNVGIYHSTVTGNTSNADGGGIYSVGGKLVVDLSTVTGNSPDGVRTRYDTDGIYTSTISGNQGYGLHPSHATHFYVNDSTVDRNAGVGLYAYMDSKTYLASSVVADSTGSDLGGFGTSILGFYSLIENVGGASFAGPHDIVGVDPALAPLADNGGPTPTDRPSNTSPLLDQGRSAVGFDQR